GALLRLPFELGVGGYKIALRGENTEGNVPAVHQFLHAFAVQIGILAVFGEKPFIHGAHANVAAFAPEMFVDKIVESIKTLGAFVNLDLTGFNAHAGIGEEFNISFLESILDGG